MQHQSQSQSSNDCYSTNEEYFLDICRSGEFDQIKEFLSTLNQQTKFDWQWASNTGDNFVHMLSGNNFPQIFVYLINQLKQRDLANKIPSLINKQNSSGNTPLHYTVITQSKQMLHKLLEYGCDPNIVNQFGRTALDQAEMISKFELAYVLAPITKQDIQKLTQQFKALDVCNEGDAQSSDEEEEDNQEKNIEEKTEQKTEQQTEQQK